MSAFEKYYHAGQVARASQSDWKSRGLTNATDISMPRGVFVAFDKEKEGYFTTPDKGVIAGVLITVADLSPIKAGKVGSVMAISQGDEVVCCIAKEQTIEKQSQVYVNPKGELVAYKKPAEGQPEDPNIIKVEGLIVLHVENQSEKSLAVVTRI